MVKKFIKNVTDDNKTVIAELERPYSPAILAYKEDGKKIELKPGEMKETKLTEEDIGCGRLRIITEDKTKKTKESE